MSMERFFIADPYNDDHIRLIMDFEEKNQISPVNSTVLKNIRHTKTAQEYEIETKESNEISQILFLQAETYITDSCHIQGEKDMKSCRIFFAPIAISSRNRKMVNLITDYVFDVLGMEDIFVTIPVKDANRSLIENLENKGFENLGEDNGNITYLKEKDIVKSNGKAVAFVA